MAPLRVPHGPRRVWKTLKISVRGPYDARTGPARGTHVVLRIIRPNHNCRVVSNRTGPVAYCDHENSTDVKFLWALHSALRARNRTGDKNRTGPMVGCDWGIRCHCSQKLFPYITLLFFAILYPTSLVNLVVEVGTGHSHQILLRKSALPRKKTDRDWI